MGAGPPDPDWAPPNQAGRRCDLASDQSDLVKEFEGAAGRRPFGLGVPAHPTTRQRPGRRLIRVFEGGGLRGVPTLVHASSVGAYRPGPEAVRRVVAHPR
ncbi:hypothetical protein SALBM311S_02385 [Streptomyces alboniger]